MERLDDRRAVAVRLAEDLAQVGERLLGAAQDALAAREDLHRHDRVEPLGGQDRARALEVHVGGLAGEHVGGRQEVRAMGRSVVMAQQCTTRGAGKRTTATSDQDEQRRGRALIRRTMPPVSADARIRSRLADRLDRAAQVAVGEPAVGQPSCARRVGAADEAEALEERALGVHGSPRSARRPRRRRARRRARPGPPRRRRMTRYACWSRSGAERPAASISASSASRAPSQAIASVDLRPAPRRSASPSSRRGPGRGRPSRPAAATSVVERRRAPRHGRQQRGVRLGQHARRAKSSREVGRRRPSPAGRGTSAW